MKDVPNVCITVAQPNGVGIPDRYTICEMDGLWVVTVEHWTSGIIIDATLMQEPYHEVVYLSAYVSLPLALEGLRSIGEVYGTWEVVEYAESLIKVIRN